MTELWDISKVAAEAAAEAKAGHFFGGSLQPTAAAMARALAEATLQLETSKRLDTRVVHYIGENEGYGQVPPYWKNKTGINFVATNNFVRDALQRFMRESSCSHMRCAATTQTIDVVSVERVESTCKWHSLTLHGHNLAACLVL
jgi:hypothetical protein